jgi:hypothetical protein
MALCRCVERSMVRGGFVFSICDIVCIDAPPWFCEGAMRPSLQPVVLRVFAQNS